MKSSAEKEVAQILDKRTRRIGRPKRELTEFLVKWKDLPDEEISWERAEDLKSAAPASQILNKSTGLTIAVLIMYVDDIVLSGDDDVEIVKLKAKMAKEFEIKDLGKLRYFLKMEVVQSRDGIVSQRKYTIDLLMETGMTGCKPVDTPVEYNSKLNNTSNPAPCEEHMIAVARILRYLKGTPGKGLMFKKSDTCCIEAYPDSDWAGSVVDRKSTSRYCTFVWGNLVTWRSKK
ncbi:uncharacterized mitochondrial protein AtMg00810-like [Benincasa hispida]|uniref:uncharacterized mitochondrial protein AtMg00810-like n=1 Tax=Benincasa hispida TaxID=102211 RepID=UPI0018FFB769|nr:uncharacterized mitochondrial protein AtMg00810-like [Benincasa hispida]